MTSNKTNLILRQINDIINQIDNLQNSRNFINDVKCVMKYSNELNNYILSNISVPEILEIVNTIKPISINKTRNKYWYHYLIIPWYVINLYNDILFKDELKQDLIDIKNKYIIIYNKLTLLLSASQRVKAFTQKSSGYPEIE